MGPGVFLRQRITSLWYEGSDIKGGGQQDDNGQKSRSVRGRRLYRVLNRVFGQFASPADHPQAGEIIQQDWL
jgi:hypothetical protein